MNLATNTAQVDENTYKKRRSWLVWLVLALILVAVPLNFFISSINPMQQDLEQCNANMELRKTPGNDLPQYSMDEFNRCADAGSSASTYFFLTSLMILFNFSALDGLIAGKVRALVAYASGLAFVIAVSLIMRGGFPIAFFTLNAPILLLLYWLWKRKELT